MKEIDQGTYEELREKRHLLIGRVHFHANPQKNKIIYFQVDECQQGMTTEEILNTLLLTNPDMEGNIDVICDWKEPHAVSINYKPL